jgi:uncharacterized ParB-like nuclease family protein
MSASTEIGLDLIRADASAQMRMVASETVVSEYAEAINSGAEFPPIVVFFDGDAHWLADGFHRLAAHQKLGYETILADVREGGLRDAIQYSLGANETHGLRRTRADKRRAVETALADPEWAALSDRDIAKLCNVTHPFVGNVRKGGNVTASKPQTTRTSGNITDQAGETGNVTTSPEKSDAGASGNVTTPANGALLKNIWQLCRVASDDELVDAISTLNRTAKQRGLICLFTVSDCDPAGYQMPVSIARKLQAIRDKDFPDLEFKVVPIALEPKQADELYLPSTPLKETEKRGDKWREAHGREQTEIDAALALAPDWLRDTITAEMSRFYDGELQQRVIDAQREWQALADARIEAIFSEEIEELREEVELIEQVNRDRVDEINERLEEMSLSIELPRVHVPVGEPPPDDGRGVLIDSSWSWFDQTRRLKDRKAYVDDDEDAA